MTQIPHNPPVKMRADYVVTLEVKKFNMMGIYKEIKAIKTIVNRIFL